MSRVLKALGVASAVFVLTGCEASKTSNPLSPNVAGPIPGVSITAPNLVQPVGGSRIPVDQQPVTLTTDNSATSGVRPLSYHFDIAVDADFANIIFSRDSITAGDGGHTSLRLVDSLATGRTYYWRARAQDGANTGPFSALGVFTIFTPIVLQPPVLISPVGNAIVESTHPRLTVQNSARSGPVGQMGYVFEISDSDSFGNMVAVYVLHETPDRTSVDAPDDLGANRQLFWRARAFEPSTQGPYSGVQAFRTPAPVVVAPPPGGGGGGGAGGSATDMLALSSVAVHGGPPDVAFWPATTAITRIDVSRGNGWNFQFSGRSSWPDFLAFGNDGYLQYTVWPVVQVNGSWHTCGVVQMWRDRPSTGAFGSSTWHDDFPNNWGYICGSVVGGYHPNPGDQMGFFMTAGNARFINGVTSIRERTNVVIITLPPGDSGSFSF